MKFKSLLKFLLCASCFCAIQDLYAQTAETEPNNTKATANNVTLNGSGSGHIKPVGDVDWWKVVTTSDGKLDVTVTDHSADYTNFYLYDVNGVIQLNSGTVGSNATATFSTDGLAAGTYYIEFTGYNTGTDTSTYTFTNTLTPAPVTNDQEPDSTKAQALTLPLNASVTGHVGYYYNNHRDSSDWYKVTTNADGLLRLTITTYPSTLNAYINYTLYDNDGVTALSSNTVGSNTTNSFIIDGLAAGTYYVKMSQYNINDYVAYKLADSLFAAPVANDLEPNNNRASALTLPLNGSATGHVGYYYNDHRDSSDWYKVTTNADGLLRFTITTYPSTLNAYINLTLYDNNGTIVLNSNTTGSNTTSTLSTDGLAAGIYYVKMSQYNINDYVAYKLADSLFAAPAANDQEPDSTRALALTLPLNGSVTGHVGYYYNNHRDSSDWYKVSTNADGLLRLTITTYPSTLNAYINYTLYDNDGVTVLSANTVGSTTTSPFTIDGLAAGTYYIKMSQYQNTDYVAYKLADSLFAAPVANDVEPNNSTATADSLPLNSTVTGHIGYYYNNRRDSSDWYKVKLNTDGMLRLTITTEPSSLNAYINYILYDSNATTVLSNNTIGSVSTNSFNIDGLAKGTYYVRMYQYSQNDYVSYKLQDSLFKYAYTADSLYEPNGSAYLAKTIGANTTTDGHFGFYYNNKRDITDWFKINYTGAGNLMLKFYHTPHLSDNSNDYVNFYVYKDTNATAVYQTTFGSETSDVVNLTSLTQGYYYVKITQYAATDFEAYALVDSFMQVNLAKGSLGTVVNGNSCGSNNITYNLSGSHAPYSVRLYRNGILYDSAITNTASITFTGLNAGNYYITVFGDGATGTAFGTSVTTQLLPPYPTALSTLNITATTATLHWNMLTCANAYSIEYRKLGASAWTMVNNISKDSLPLTGLTMGTAYEWKVSTSETLNNITLTSIYSKADTFITATVLPVTFINFNGKIAGDQALLSWSTAREINNKGFEVEKSYDGQTFSDLGFVAGAVTSQTINNYNYSDIKVLSGNNYYRIRQINNDGTFNYSSVIKLNYTAFSWELLGNPAANNSWLELQLDKQTKVSVHIISLNGTTLQIIDKGSLSAGTYSIPLNLNNLSSGMYIVRLITDNNQDSKKLIR